MVEQMLNEAEATLHIDIVSTALRLFLNIPIVVLKTKYQSTTTKPRAKKLWEAYSGSKGDFGNITVILVDNNGGFVAPAVASCQAVIHEEFTMTISALEDAKDNFKCITSLVPEGSKVHKAIVFINSQIKAAHRVAKSANLAMGTADVASGTTKFLCIPHPPGQQFLVPRTKKESVLNTKCFNCRERL